jgi:hypothetical protein
MKAIGIGITLNDLTEASVISAAIGHDFDLDITS